MIKREISFKNLHVCSFGNSRSFFPSREALRLASVSTRFLPTSLKHRAFTTNSGSDDSKPNLSIVDEMLRDPKHPAWERITEKMFLKMFAITQKSKSMAELKILENKRKILENERKKAEAMELTVELNRKAWLMQSLTKKQHIKPVSEYSPNPLPKPIDFQPSKFNPSVLVADVDRVGPFFFSQHQFSKLRGWVEADDSFPDASSAPSILVFAGTVKSGKSTLLSKVLPGLISAHYHTDPSNVPYPVILHISIGLSHTPMAAAEHISQHSLAFARNIGLSGVYIDTSPSVVLESLSQKVHEKGGRLWVLLDEVQAPAIHSSSRSQTDGFFNEIKRIAEVCEEYHGRVALTGSSMLQVLYTLAHLPKNSYDLWGSAQIVSQGHSCGLSDFKEIASELLCQNKIPLSAEELVQFFSGICQNPALFSHHPALLAHFLHILRKKTSKAVPMETQLVKAWEKVTDKLHEEMEASTIAGLELMDTQSRLLLLSVAKGELSKEQLLEKEGGKKLWSVIEPLCEVVPPNTPVVLQSPYPSYVVDWIVPSSGQVAMKL